MYRAQLFTLVFITVVSLSVTCSDFASAKSEADWFYQAATLEARFDKIAAAKVPYELKTGDFEKLLEDVRAFGAAAGTTERETRGRKAFSLECAGWIQQMLAQPEQARATQAECQKFLESMPEHERDVVTAFFEKGSQKVAPVSSRFCNVEARGIALKVKAVDWPIRDLFEKMAAASGVKIEVPKEVCGVVDYDSAASGGEMQWTPVDTILMDMCPPRGLAMWAMLGRDAVAPLRVRVTDPLYMASIGERADKRVRLEGLVAPDKGIEHGYVILHGYYIRPPYAVTVKEDQDKLTVCINGVAVDEGRTLSPPKPRVIPPLSEVRDQEDLAGAVSNMFHELRKEHGKIGAANMVRDVLDHHPLVKSARVDPDGNSITIVRVGWDIQETIGLIPLDEIESGKELDQETRLANWRRQAIQYTNELKARVEKTLQDGGLVFASGSPGCGCYSARDSRRMLADICNAMHEITRCRESIASAIYDPASSPRQYDAAWEVALNLRYKEVLEDTSGVFGK